MFIKREYLIYFFKNYPLDKLYHFTVDRTSKMFYLLDWHHCINFGEQVTHIKWQHNGFVGPFTEEIEETVQYFSNDFERYYSLEECPMYRLKNDFVEPIIQEQSHKFSLDHVIESTSKMERSKFDCLVHSTHPIYSQRFESKWRPWNIELNLVEFAKEYNEMRKKEF